MPVTTRQSIANAASKNMGITKSDSYRLVGEVFQAMREALVRGDSIEIIGFGFFKVVRRKKRYGHIPHPKHYRAGEWVEIPERNVVTFKAAKVMNGELNKAGQ